MEFLEIQADKHLNVPSACVPSLSGHATELNANGRILRHEDMQKFTQVEKLPIL